MVLHKQRRCYILVLDSVDISGGWRREKPEKSLKDKEDYENASQF